MIYLYGGRVAFTYDVTYFRILFSSPPHLHPHPHPNPHVTILGKLTYLLYGLGHVLVTKIEDSPLADDVICERSLGTLPIMAPPMESYSVFTAKHTCYVNAIYQ